jgi:hypothetical protein
MSCTLGRKRRPTYRTPHPRMLWRAENLLHSWRDHRTGVGAGPLRRRDKGSEERGHADRRALTTNLGPVFTRVDTCALAASAASCSATSHAALESSTGSSLRIRLS